MVVDLTNGRQANLDMGRVYPTAKQLKDFIRKQRKQAYEEGRRIGRKEMLDRAFYARKGLGTYKFNEARDIEELMRENERIYNELKSELEKE
jgi:protein-disulfide isomerase-like protein with CxxC motif